MRVLGLDLGIASIGWAVVDIEAGAVLAAGARTFDKPETPKERTPTNAIRRGKRLARRTLRRRRQRMAHLRILFHEFGLLPRSDRDALHAPPASPWSLRAAALERVLTPQELAVTLGHIARHRGFWSNSKRDRGDNAAADTSKMLNAVTATSQKAAMYRTVGAMLALDPEFDSRKRNRTGDYGRTLKRDDLRHEIRVIFESQRRLGSPCATDALQERFETTAFHQLPLQDHTDKLGDCLFEPTQKRTSRQAYSFEMFRLLAKLNNLTLQTGSQTWTLSAEQIGAITTDFGSSLSITYKSIRKILDLSPATKFEGVAEESHDVALRSGKAAEGTYRLREAMGGAWRSLLVTPARLDRVAEILAFRESLDSIRAGLVEAGLEPTLTDALLHAAEAGKFAKFSRAGHISAAAARALNPHLARGLKYHEACAEAGYDHAARPATSLNDIGSPVARKALAEAIKQVRAITQRHGIPDHINVELARDVGKGAKERQEITSGIEHRNAEKDRRRAEFAEIMQRPIANDDELLRYELWREQGGFCLYSGEAIAPSALAAEDNAVQVDHILPWSRFGDDSFVNKALCTARANQHKRGRTPWEWFTADQTQSDWDAFERRVELCKEMKGRKKRGFYLRRNAAEVEEKFRERNLNDTRIASRLLLDALKRLYPSCTVSARPGALTSKLRRAWGIEFLKKDAAGKRLDDDRHHALDAIILAATTQSMVQRLTAAFQQSEARGLPRDFGKVDEPWPGFRARAIAATEAVFVSRAERHRAPGEAHAATIKQVRIRDGKTVVYERQDIFALKPADINRIKDPVQNSWLAATLRDWFEAGRPKDRLPRSHKGDEIRKVRLISKDKVAVEVRGGTADHGKMVRVDVFAEIGPKGQRLFQLLPIYPHQVAALDAAPQPKNSGRKGTSKPEFLFSIRIHSLIEVERTGKPVLRRYFKGLDISAGIIKLGSVEAVHMPPTRVGFREANELRKLQVDRLGEISTVAKEVRTWRGAVCT